MTFIEWILHFKDVDRPIGDLAKDIEKDSNFPTTNDRLDIREYLMRKTNTQPANDIINTFDNAWNYYQVDNF